MTDKSARDLLAQYKERGFAMIEEQLKESAEEGENLDFKQCNSDGGKLDRKDKQNFAETASAFANTSGGVLVWGVECKKNDQQIDAVSALKPFDKLAAFRSALKTNMPTALQPGLNGIDFLPILYPGKDDVGFLVVFVPAAVGEPVRAEACDTKRYHIRIGDQTHIMPHSTLADRFGRRPHPRLELHFWRSALGDSGGKPVLTITFAVYNAGLGIAKHLMVRLQMVTGLAIYCESNGSMYAEPAARLNPVGEAEQAWTGKPGVVIHPGTYQQITTATITLPNSSTSLDFDLPYTILCEGDCHEGVLKLTTGPIKGGVVYKDERKLDSTVNEGNPSAAAST